MTKEEVRPLLEKSKRTLIALMSRNLPPDTTKEQLEAILDTEIFYFEYHCLFNPELLKCQPKTIEYGFRKVIMMNLSFDKDLGLIYVQTRNNKNPQFIALECNPSVNGMISNLLQCGSLIDLAEPVLTYNSDGLVESCTVGLICPTYNSAGETTGKDVKEFTFKEKDFFGWRQKSHDLYSQGGSKGVRAKANLAGEGYWSFVGNKPEGTIATGDNGVGGIVPSFCITKCTRHAIGRAKLERNPYAKRYVYVNHKRYVDEGLDDETIPESYERAKPDFTSEEMEVKPEAREVKPEPAKEVRQEVRQEIKVDSRKEEEARILELVKSCQYSEDATKIWNQHKEFISASDKFKTEFVAIGSKKPKKPTPNQLTNQEPAKTIQEPAKTINSPVTSDDL